MSGKGATCCKGCPQFLPMKRLRLFADLVQVMVDEEVDHFEKGVGRDGARPAHPVAHMLSGQSQMIRKRFAAACEVCRPHEGPHVHRELFSHDSPNPVFRTCFVGEHTAWPVWRGRCCPSPAGLQAESLENTAWVLEVTLKEAPTAAANSSTARLPPGQL